MKGRNADRIWRSLLSSSSPLIKVLSYLAKEGATSAFELSIALYGNSSGYSTVYKATHELESVGLVAETRAMGQKRTEVFYFTLTPAGALALASIMGPKTDLRDASIDAGGGMWKSDFLLLWEEIGPVKITNLLKDSNIPRLVSRASRVPEAQSAIALMLIMGMIFSYPPGAFLTTKQIRTLATKSLSIRKSIKQNAIQLQSWSQIIIATIGE